MKIYLFLALLVFLSGCASHKVHNMGLVTENLESITALSYDENFLYIQFAVKEEGESIARTRWAKASRQRIWKHAMKAEHYMSSFSEYSLERQNLRDFPTSVEYSGTTYEIYFGIIFPSISDKKKSGWRIVHDAPKIQELTEAVAIQKESKSEINPQNPVFGESNSDLFLFTYPDRQPQLVLLDRDQKKAMLIREFKSPQTYVITEAEYTTLKAVATPLAATVDIATLPVLIPVILSADPSGK